ncbi:DUF1328 domain-containing protein [Methylomarinum sp. Ch1-1]|uniref:UPF0391 membrane protein Q9L42_004575 n=1 Tax=Methylomarinum roseum TaxID=3067653 RepID=A0AAU7NWT2_9GAMM|nr:DUF1328 domain-containing protein [Methylomarinum sp. Ch1-1]MDP4522531.1 DUF1328 domain-containing protein [Methylomarinum sp. Ch1-1]
MLRWAFIFLIAAIFGFGDVAAVATEAARILFFVFLALFIMTPVFVRRHPSLEQTLWIFGNF